jgi:hypothetical protein
VVSLPNPIFPYSFFVHSSNLWVKALAFASSPSCIHNKPYISFRYRAGFPIQLFKGFLISWLRHPCGDQKVLGSIPSLSPFAGLLGKNWQINKSLNILGSVHVTWKSQVSERMRPSDLYKRVKWTSNAYFYHLLAKF